MIALQHSDEARAIESLLGVSVLLLKNLCHFALATFKDLMLGNSPSYFISGIRHFTSVATLLFTVYVFCQYFTIKTLLDAFSVLSLTLIVEKKKLGSLKIESLQ